MLTLSVIRASTAVVLLDPISISPRDARGGRSSLATLALLLPFVVAVFAFFRRPSFSARRLKLAFALAMLLGLTLGWASACNQFSVPATPPPPVQGTQPVMGNLTVTAKPSGGSQVTVMAPYTVQ